MPEGSILSVEEVLCTIHSGSPAPSQRPSQLRGRLPLIQRQEPERLQTSDETRLSHGVMEGKGAYNKYAKLPAGGAALALPLLEKAVRGIRLDTADQPVVIADYGSTQGKNSLAPLRVALKTLRSHLHKPYM